ncbi:SDR family oxidoreductase [Teredinibacter haidensis]|uniref:SDR family oxidoreductase n=1 Tax=Teredinibacter haidensis TaxID=2731755 RepID=UPI0009491331|nr:SDR family oxidoreductase [Teredinibacter haidensis]
MAQWTASDIPSQLGRSAIITGTGGLGFEGALALAKAGGEVIIAGRNAEKGAAAIARIHSEVPFAAVRFELLDLASLASIKNFGERLRSQRGSLDLLINNAGVMVPPKRQETEDGFELQLGTNYLGHFVLTAELMPLLVKGKSPRVVTLSSIAARNGAISFDDLNAQKSYTPMQVYNQSKLACLMFAFELQRHSEANGWGVTSIAAHPGISRTDLLHNAPGRRSVIGITRSLLWFMFQPASQGTLPTLFAATSPFAKGGAYYGPDKLGEIRGAPTEAQIPPQALDVEVSVRLWEVSKKLTGASL